MLQTYEAVLQPNGQLQFLEPLKLAGSMACRVLVTVIEPVFHSPPPGTDWKRFAGTLRASPNLNEDPVAIQQGMRHEWD
ncbi:MAG: hypothetical protein K2X65_01575 [Burkholderiaceae bacterium]|nr:hypothetical protein [Burkholderiaceae bacterium]